MTERLDDADGRGFLAEPAASADVQRLYDTDLTDDGYVNNLTRAWAHQPAIHDLFWSYLGGVAAHGDLDLRTRGVLVCATAATLRDRYCAHAWGRKLAAEAGEEVAVAVLDGRDDDLEPRDRALARWARRVAGDAWGIGPDDVEEVRAAGIPEAQIAAVTMYVAGRIAFSTTNAALGARPDAELLARTPAPVRAAVDRVAPPPRIDAASRYTPGH